MTHNNISNDTGIQHVAYAEDWSSDLDTQAYIDSLSRGITTLNVFVGQLDSNGQIDGFSTDTPGTPAGTGAFKNTAELTDFITKLKAKGISVKLSIGGQAGTAFGNSWNNLTDTNLQTYADSLAALCKTTGADGIDFDEEMADTTVAARAGKLAALLNAEAPDLSLTYCVFMGNNDHDHPGMDANRAFLLNAVKADGTSVIDHVFTMPYEDGLSESDNEIKMMDWALWLENNLHMSASQLSAGVDPTDPNTSESDGSLQKWVLFAKQNGFSTSIWDNANNGSGIDDYVSNDWGSVVMDIWNGQPIPPAAPTGNLSFITYVVQPGDTLYALSKKFHISVALLEKLNPSVNPDNLQPGQQLEVLNVFYTIQAGDTLYALAQKLGTTVAELEALNPGITPDNLTPGQVIIVNPDLDVLPSSFNATYTVMKGDSLWAIAQEFGTTVAELEQDNPGVTPDNLTPGQVINIKK